MFIYSKLRIVNLRHDTLVHFLNTSKVKEFKQLDLLIGLNNRIIHVKPVKIYYL